MMLVSHIGKKRKRRLHGRKNYAAAAALPKYSFSKEDMYRQLKIL